MRHFNVLGEESCHVLARFEACVGHLGIGRAHTRTEIICLIHNNNATIIALNTAEILAEFTLNPAKNYQRKNG